MAQCEADRLAVVAQVLQEVEQNTLQKIQKTDAGCISPESRAAVERRVAE
ncbi:hypothetical protein IWQ55_006186 [Labrenzia sp. EL_208]|nr:hypothetical protein [Labrenzia sp. EL_132]MBG6211548.1 hypothetical protein [Labrenzia sp. EL_126]MBG6232952.1 hypothetical protein [Labrenzia sp. EL_208]